MSMRLERRHVTIPLRRGRLALSALALAALVAGCKNKDNSLPPEPRGPDAPNVRVAPAAAPASAADQPPDTSRSRAR